MTDPQGETPEAETEAAGLADKADIDMEKYHDEDGYDFDAAFREVAGEPFRFRWAGEWWELPHILNLDRRSLAKFYAMADLPDSSDIDAVAVLVGDILHTVLGEEKAAEFDKTPQPPMKLTMLFNQWKDHSGVDQGEVSSSAASSNGTAGPSKRTSRSGASTSAKRSTARKKTAARRVNSSR